MEKTTIPRRPFTVDWLCAPNPRPFAHRRLGMRQEDCACADGYRGADCTSQQAVGCVRQLLVTGNFRRGGAGLRARLLLLAGAGRGAAQGPLGAVRHGGCTPDAHDLAGPEGGR